MKAATLADTLHSRVVRRACDLGSLDKLANQLRVSRAMLERWIAGTATPPPRVFFRLLQMVRSADPAYLARTGNEQWCKTSS
jgi:hypothetical protein